MIHNFAVYLKWIIISIIIFVKESNAQVVTSSDTSVKIFRLYYWNNTVSTFNANLNHDYAIFDDYSSNTLVSASYLNLGANLEINRRSGIYSKVHLDRQWLSMYQNTVINSICELTYNKTMITLLDNKFCCRLVVSDGLEMLNNESTSCKMSIQATGSTRCYIRLNVKLRKSQLGRFNSVSVYGIVHRTDNSGLCTGLTTTAAAAAANWETSSSSYQYSRSNPVTISVTGNHPPVYWHQAFFTQNFPVASTSTLLIGVPLYSLAENEQILIPVRFLSHPDRIGTQFLKVTCAVAKPLFVLDVVGANKHSIIAEENKFKVYVKVRQSHGGNGEIFSLNVTLKGELQKQFASSDQRAAVNCCLYLGGAESGDLDSCLTESGSPAYVPLQDRQNRLIIVPVVRDTRDEFAIYRLPKKQLPSNAVSVYLVSNIRDGAIQDATGSSDLKVSPLYPAYLNITSQSAALMSSLASSSSSNSISYQDSVNPWSLQISFYRMKTTIISPIRIWRAESWRIVLSNNKITVINNWSTPQSGNSKGNCEPLYRQVRLRILCRMFRMEESGQRIYLGERGSRSQQQQQQQQLPFVDVTEMTESSQLQVSNNNKIKLTYSAKEKLFLIQGDQVGRARISLLDKSRQQKLLVSRTVSVGKSAPTNVKDIVVKCISGVEFQQAGKKVKQINKPEDYECVTMKLVTRDSLQQCYLLLWLVFDDGSIESLSHFNKDHYQLQLTTTDTIDSSSSGSSSSSSNRQLKKLKNVVELKNEDYVNVKLKSKQKTDDGAVENITQFVLKESTSCNFPRTIFSKLVRWGDSNIQYIQPVVEKTKLETELMSSSNRDNKEHSLPNKSDSEKEADMQSSYPSPTFIYISIFTIILILCILIPVVILLHRVHSRKRAPPRPSSHAGLLSLSAVSNFNVNNNNNNNSANGQYAGKQKENNSTSFFRAIFSKSNNNVGNYSNRTSSIGKDNYPPLLPPPGPISSPHTPAAAAIGTVANNNNHNNNSNIILLHHPPGTSVQSHNLHNYNHLHHHPHPIAYEVDPICNDSAIDSGIELGKLSSYSSNTNPSNETDAINSSTNNNNNNMSSSLPRSLHHQQQQHQQQQQQLQLQDQQQKQSQSNNTTSSGASNPLSDLYSTNTFDSAASECNDSITIPCYKTISNLRHPVHW